uniref:Uncharacterized protein n=1 Tax=Ditylenchus dipsaci TaxID=166011 RepID=A0A915D4X4_9BILA
MGVCSASNQLMEVAQLNELSGSRERVMQAIRGHFSSTNALMYELAERAIEDDELMRLTRSLPGMKMLNAYELVRSDNINPITLRPRDDEWYCVNCQNGSYEPDVCGNCSKPRCLDSEELEQLRKSEQSGEQLFESVLMAEYTKEDLASESEFLRHQLGLLVQTFSIGQKKFILVAFPFPNCVDFSKDPKSEIPSTEEYVRQALAHKNCRDIEVLDFTKMSLNHITKEILALKFQIKY